MAHRSLKWTDVFDIAIELEARYPDENILGISFPSLWKRVQQLPQFEDSPENANEKILEAIQQAWLNERDA